jgi:hypothetical protein
MMRVLHVALVVLFMSCAGIVATSGTPAAILAVPFIAAAMLTAMVAIQEHHAR